MEFTAPVKTTQNQKFDASFIGSIEYTERKSLVDQTLNISLGFIKLVLTLIDGWWPALLIKMLQPDANNQPSLTLPPLICFSIDVLNILSIESFFIIDFLYDIFDYVMNALGIPDEYVIEIIKDYIIPATTFSSLLSISWVCFRNADGLRIAQQYGAMLLATVAGLIPLTLAFLLIDDFHDESRQRGKDDWWSVFYYLSLTMGLFLCVFSVIPQAKVECDNRLTHWSGTYIYYFMKLFRKSIYTIPADWNPVTGLITCSFILLSFVYCAVKMGIYYALAVGT